MKKFLCLFLCVIIAFSLNFTAFASGEEKCHASWKLETSSTLSAGKSVDVLIYLKSDYVTNIFGAVVTYDKTFYEPANATESDNFVVAPSIANLGNKTVVLSEKKSQSVADKMYDESYSKDMKSRYALAWFSFTFLATKFSNPSVDTFPGFDDYTLVATLKLKVKPSAKSGLVGNIFLDEVYQQKDAGKQTRKYTFVSHANSEIVGKCSSTVRYGQTIDFSQAVLFKSISMNDVEIQYKSSQNISPEVETFGSAKYTCSFESSNPSVVLVDSDSNAVGLKRGSAVITCTVTDQNGVKASDSCMVTVKYSWWQWIIVIFLFGWIWY